MTTEEKLRQAEDAAWAACIGRDGSPSTPEQIEAALDEFCEVTASVIVRRRGRSGLDRTGFGPEWPQYGQTIVSAAAVSAAFGIARMAARDGRTLQARYVGEKHRQDVHAPLPGDRPERTAEELDIARQVLRLQLRSARYAALAVLEP